MILHGAWHKVNRSGKKPLSPALRPEPLLLFSALGQGFRPPAPLVPLVTGLTALTPSVSPGILAAEAGHGKFQQRGGGSSL